MPDYREVGDKAEIELLDAVGKYRVQDYGLFGKVLIEPASRGFIGTIGGNRFVEQDLAITATNFSQDKLRRRKKEKQAEYDSLASKLIKSEDSIRFAAQSKFVKNLRSHQVSKDLERYISGMFILGKAYLRNCVVVVGEDSDYKDMLDLEWHLNLKNVMKKSDFDRKYKSVREMGSNQISMRYWNHSLEDEEVWRGKKKKEVQLTHNLGKLCLVKKRFRHRLLNVLEVNDAYVEFLDKNEEYYSEVMDYFRKRDAGERVRKPRKPKVSEAESKQGFVNLDDGLQERLEHELWLTVQYFAPDYFMYISRNPMGPHETKLMDGLNSSYMTVDEFMGTLERGELFDEVKEFKAEQGLYGCVNEGLGRAQNVLDYCLTETELSGKRKRKLVNKYLNRAQIPGVGLGKFYKWFTIITSNRI